MLHFTLSAAYWLLQEIMKFVRAADELLPSAFQFLIQLVKDDVGQQRRKRSTPGSSQVAQGRSPGVNTSLSVRECRVCGYA
jgi:hypothetical protein